MKVYLIASSEVSFMYVYVVDPTTDCFSNWCVRKRYERGEDCDIWSGIILEVVQELQKSVLRQLATSKFSDHFDKLTNTKGNVEVLVECNLNNLQKELKMNMILGVI
ncbi:hypothetical protein PYDG_00018 [Pseudoalteromonas phage pYD6-A]|uniref:Uncharacterized protein n=1 Tax=Pseudoalteromonas phage pYD6-A TaxID=754052 RepID=M4SQG7_9CAUD|nr:hypothetical protein PYDG_00018 [Pseudoalteromonas phage pYD6-A]AGH57550.1 hypothetical protein PYDG_00018 [Pseudoalteromonas phage pYD6-A]